MERQYDLVRVVTRSLATALVGAVWIGLVGAVWIGAAPVTYGQTNAGPPAQGDPPSTPAPAPGKSDKTTEVTDQKLDAVAAALEQVASIKENYQQKMENADLNDRRRLATEAQNALVNAVTDHGISVEEYVSILEVAQNNSTVRERLFQRIRPQDK